jgi:hypothetical protein
LKVPKETDVEIGEASPRYEYPSVLKGPSIFKKSRIVS